jgi:hypothetical protein
MWTEIKCFNRAEALNTASRVTASFPWLSLALALACYVLAIPNMDDYGDPISQTTTRPRSALASPALSDHDTDEAEHEDLGAGDYSARLHEIMNGVDNIEQGDVNGDAIEEEEEEDFVYDGVDAEPRGDYREQLRDILGPDHEDDELEEKDVEQTILLEATSKEDTIPIMNFPVVSVCS